MNINDAIFIFSLGPVQGFIAEARRLGDLDAGSRLLVKLATAAGVAIKNKGGALIFPAKLGADVPNKLVARVPADSVEAMARAAQQAIQDEWQKYVSNARQRMVANGPSPDDVWKTIWNRQVNSLWETYWAAVPETGDYHAAYDAASRAFDAAKRTRTFPQIEEGGVKDSLSGRRSALRTGDMQARDYWAQIAESPNITRAELRPGGRERLDAIGTIKRWGGLVKSSPSVSLIAAADFMAAAKKEKSALAMYRQIVEKSPLGDYLFPVSSDVDWPYGGDLFFLETLTPERLGDSYGLEQPEDGPLEVVRQNLRSLYRKVNSRPRPYYAIIALDGDGMGKMVNNCRTEGEHQTLSQNIIAFAGKVRPIVEKHLGHTVYAGGDDVLALAPLSTALPLAQELAVEFHNVVGGTASAGIAVAHRLYPLSATLRAAREAEHRAKQVPDKATLCARVLKRSGETVDARTTWAAMGDTFECLVNLFQSKALSSKMAYAAVEVAYALPIADESFESELRRQLRRHRHPTKWTESEDAWAATLRTWAEHLPNHPPDRKTAELGRWLTLARFVAQGGAE